MLCTATGGAWCAASPASHTPPCRSCASGATRTTRVSTSKSASAAPCTREPSPRSAARTAPSMSRARRRPTRIHPASSLERPVDTRQVGIEDDALQQEAPRLLRSRRWRRPAPRDGRPSRYQPSAARPNSHLVGTDDIRRSDRLASHDEPLGSRDRIAGRDLVECGDFCPDSGVFDGEALESVSPTDLEVLPRSASSAVLSSRL